MDITWDDRKAEANLKKHGVSFDEAATVLSNPLTLMNQNDHPDGDRWEYIGQSVRRRLLYVVTVEKMTEDEIRIVSARKATAHEREKYEEGQGV